MTRVIDAPRELVFRAWLDPHLLQRWSAPRGYSITHSSATAHPGGAWRCCLRSEEGEDFWLGGSYREIVPPGLLVFTHAWGGVHETLITATFADVGGKTLLTLRQEGFKSTESHDGHGAGWGECLDGLARLLRHPESRAGIGHERA